MTFLNLKHMAEKFIAMKPSILNSINSRRSKSIAPKMKIKKSEIVKTIGKNIYRKSTDTPPMKIKLKLKEGMFNDLEDQDYLSIAKVKKSKK